MSPPHSRRTVLTMSSVAGLSLLAGCQGVLSSGDPRTPTDTESADRDDSLGLAYSESEASFPSDQETHSGWVHIVSDGESADLTFDVRVCHSLGDVEPELTTAGGSEYVLRFLVDADFGGEAAPGTPTDDRQCGSVTRLVGGANVPADWERLTVEVNDTEIQTIERSGTLPELRPLPDPVR